MVRLKAAHATTNGRRKPCGSLTLTPMSSPQPSGQTEDSGEVKRWEGLESGVICHITSTNLKPFHRESNSETTDGGLCYTHTHTCEHTFSGAHTPKSIKQGWFTISKVTGEQQTQRTRFRRVSCRRLVTTKILLCTPSRLYNVLSTQSGDTKQKNKFWNKNKIIGDYLLLSSKVL